MKLKVKRLRFFTGRPVCMIHEKDSNEIDAHVGERVSIKRHNKELISVVNTIAEILKPGEVAVSEEIFKSLNLSNHEIVEVEIAKRPHSIDLIKKKLLGETLKKAEINEIIQNISDNSLTETEVAFFVSAVYSNGMTLRETKNLTQAMVKSGNLIKLRGKVVDKHCIGGVAGNRTTPIVVSICASAGLIMPKTSSRAITSAAGTADVIETLAKVGFKVEDIKKIIKKTKACFVWGGALGLAPADDKIIRIERIVNIDSTAQLLASILSKKLSVDSEFILIDIPYGPSAKVTKRQADKLKGKFLKLGRSFGLKLEVLLTDGSEPIGNGVGPVLEMKDILKVLTRVDSPPDLEKRSLVLSGKLLELAGKAKKGKGIDMAKKILDSGKAFDKFKEIIKAQKGKIKPLKLGRYSYPIRAKRKIKIKHLDNKLINRLARVAGSPEDKAAGIYLHNKKNRIVEKGEKILTIYAQSKEKLEYAKKFYKDNKKKVFEVKS